MVWKNQFLSLYFLWDKFNLFQCSENICRADWLVTKFLEAFKNLARRKQGEPLK